MKLFKNLDNFLLRNYPSIWITRVHFFLPIGLTIITIVFLINAFSGWDPKEVTPDGEIYAVFMVIPVLIYLVYWFIFQSRYNVVKSGGKVNLFLEYINLFLYASVFTVALFFILVIPLSDDAKMKFSVGFEEYSVDIDNLDKGSGIMDGYIREADQNGYYVFTDGEFLDYYYDYDYYSGSEYESFNTVKLAKREVLNRIKNYIVSYNKYTKNTIRFTPEQALAERLEYNKVVSDNYYWQDSVEEKMRRLKKIYSSNSSIYWLAPESWLVFTGIIFWLSMFVWIFKQMNLRHFVIGLISICLTPLAVVILGVIIFTLISQNHRIEERIGLNLILLCYAVIGFLVVRGYFQKRLNQSAYVLTMYLHFWLPLLPLFIFLRLLAQDYRPFYWNERILGLKPEIFIFWVTFALGLISLALFKPLYSKFRSLPMHK